MGDALRRGYYAAGEFAGRYSAPITLCLVALGVAFPDVFAYLALALAVILIETVVAPVSIPLTLELLVGQTVEVDVLSMMGNMMLTIVIPTVAGTAVNDRSHGWAAEHVRGKLGPLARLLLFAIILANSTSIAPYLRDLTPERVGVIVFIGAFAAASYALGFALARKMGLGRPETVTVCLQCGMRNITLGAVITAAYLPPEVMLPVMSGTLFQQVLAATTGSLISRA